MTESTVDILKPVKWTCPWCKKEYTSIPLCYYPQIKFHGVETCERCFNKVIAWLFKEVFK